MGSQVLSVRRADAQDAAFLATFGARAFVVAFGPDNHPDDMASYVEESFALPRVREQLDDPNTTFLLLHRAGAADAVGYAKLRAGDPDPAVSGRNPVELERIYVDPDGTGSGLGGALLRACLAHAADAGHDVLWLGVWEHNDRAIAFYRRWGFEQVGTHPFVLGREHQTDLVLQRPTEPLRDDPTGP